MDPLYVRGVVARQATGSFLVIDSNDTKYITSDAWMASMAQQYQKAGTPVRIDSSSGWFYRNLSDIKPLTGGTP